MMAHEDTLRDLRGLLFKLAFMRFFQYECRRVSMNNRASRLTAPIYITPFYFLCSGHFEPE